MKVLIERGVDISYEKNKEYTNDLLYVGIKTFKIIIIGLIIAILLYPFLHECGHAIVACIVGAKIVEQA